MFLIKKLKFTKTLVAFSLILSSTFYSIPTFAAEPIYVQIGRDYKNFYTDGYNYLYLFGSWGLGTSMALSPLDQMVADAYAKVPYEANRARFSAISKVFGDKWFALLYIALSLADPDDPAISGTFMYYPAEWGRRNMRAILLGLPLLYAGQFMLGGARPDDRSKHKSYWRGPAYTGGCFNSKKYKDHDCHAISGHAFMGALPFITAAEMSEHWALKTVFYIASTFPAWSRVNDHKHYLSQAFMGWALAWRSAAVVNSSREEEKLKLTISPWGDGENMGLSLDLRF